MSVHTGEKQFALAIYCCLEYRSYHRLEIIGQVLWLLFRDVRPRVCRTTGSTLDLARGWINSGEKWRRKKKKKTNNAGGLARCRFLYTYKGKKKVSAMTRTMKSRWRGKIMITSNKQNIKWNFLWFSISIF